MKYILIILTILLFSCTKPTRKNSVNNPSVKTTVYLQSLPKDTLIVSYEDKVKNPYIYVWEDNLITEIHTISNDSTVDNIIISDILLILFFILCFGFILGITISL